MNLPIALSPQSIAAWRQVQRTLQGALLMANASGYGNDDLLAAMLSGRIAGYGMLPGHLGLGALRLAYLLHRHFPKYAYTPAETEAPAQLPEHEDLLNLLLRYRAGVDDSEYDVAVMVATACAGCDHLWQDLGLPNRNMLSALFARNFPELAAKNSGDMKWKKFLYKQLCEEEGIYVCRAPSCAECKDKPDCFGPEK